MFPVDLPIRAKRGCECINCLKYSLPIDDIVRFARGCDGVTIHSIMSSIEFIVEALASKLEYATHFKVVSTHCHDSVILCSVFRSLSMVVSLTAPAVRMTGVLRTLMNLSKKKDMCTSSTTKTREIIGYLIGRKSRSQKKTRQRPLE